VAPNEIPNPGNALTPHPKKKPPVLSTKGSEECSTFLLCAWQHAAYFEMVWGYYRVDMVDFRRLVFFYPFMCRNLDLLSEF